MEEKIKKVLAEIFELDENNISEELKLEQIPLWDSLNHLRMVTALESTFAITLTMEEVNSLNDVRQIQEVISRHS